MVAPIPEKQDKTTLGEKAATSLRPTVMSRQPPLKPTVEKQATPVNVPKPMTKKVTKEKPKPITDRTTTGRPKPQTKKSTIEKPRPQTPKKSLRIGDFQLYPKWDIEEDYHRDPSAKKTVRKAKSVGLMFLTNSYSFVKQVPFFILWMYVVVICIFMMLVSMTGIVNGAVIKGFEDDVGVRTSFYVHTAQTMISSLRGYKRLGFTNVPMDKVKIVT
ncbi:UNVERIFIED_CONTAM: hypothetical protein FKN15_076389 [Acipenser sinensis]